MYHLKKTHKNNGITSHHQYIRHTVNSCEPIHSQRISYKRFGDGIYLDDLKIESLDRNNTEDKLKANLWGKKATKWLNYNKKMIELEK